MFGSTQPNPDRWRLGFKEAVLANFAFLSSYGLRPVAEDATLVRYESDAVTVSVYHGRASYEIGVEIGRKDRQERYGLGYLVSRAGEQARETQGFGRGVMFQVSTPEGVKNSVPKVAELVRTCGDQFLSGNPAFYDQLAEENERASITYERQQMVDRIRKEADAAWSAKDLPRVVELYSPVADQLTEIEAGRLAYARKRTNPHSTADKCDCSVSDEASS
jgi:hypothetical protein